MKWIIDEVGLLICKFDGKLVYLDTANLRILKILEIGMTKTLHQGNKRLVQNFDMGIMAMEEWERWHENSLA